MSKARRIGINEFIYNASSKDSLMFDVRMYDEVLCEVNGVIFTGAVTFISQKGCNVYSKGLKGYLPNDTNNNAIFVKWINIKNIIKSHDKKGESR